MLEKNTLITSVKKKHKPNYKYLTHGCLNLGEEIHEENILFKVIDTGIGIKKNDQETIFNSDTNLSENDTSNIKLEVNNIFSKLKRKTLPIRVDNDDNTDKRWNIEELINKKEFELLLENQEKIIGFCKSIIEKLN